MTQDYYTPLEVFKKYQAEHGAHPLKLNLAELLKLGFIRAEAKWVFALEGRNRREAYATRVRNPADLGYRTVDRDAWRYAADPKRGFGFARGNWEKGNFYIVNCRDPKTYTFIIDTRFRAKDIDETLSQKTSSIHMRKGGGAKPLLDDWDKFWLEAIQAARVGRMKVGGFRTQRSMVEELKLSSRTSLSEESLERRVKMIWDRFLDPTNAASNR